MEMDYRDIGVRIRKARKAAGMSQERLAEAVGVGTTHISHIETGKVLPSMSVFISLLNVLQISADEVVAGNVERSEIQLMKAVQEILEDCTPEQRRKLIWIMRSMKEVL